MSKLATFRIDEELWAQFQDIAKANNSSASSLIVRYIQDAVKGQGIDTNIDNTVQRIDNIHIDNLEHIIDKRIGKATALLYSHIEALSDRLGELRA